MLNIITAGSLKLMNEKRIFSHLRVPPAGGTLLFRFGAGLLVSCFLFATDASATESGALIWDTGTHSPDSLSPEAVAKREGWKELTGRNITSHGDICMANEYLVLVFRKGARGGEWYYRLGESLVKGPTLVSVGTNGDKAKALNAFTIMDSTATNALLEADVTSEAGKKMLMRFSLKKEKPFVETQPGEGTEKIRVETRSQHAIIPDLYGGDLVITAQHVQRSQIHFPSENMVLQLTDNGNAIVMCVWRSRDQQVNMSLDGTAESRAVSTTEIEYKQGKDFNVWVALIAAPAIWYQQRIAELNPVKDKRLNWKVPFCLQWQADYRRTDGLIDSWPLLIKKSSGEYEKPAGKYEGFRLWLKNRTVTSSARGHYPYPGYVENDTAYLRNSNFEGQKEIQYEAEDGVLIYPFQRIAKSPVGVFGALEILSEAPKDTPEARLPEELPVKRPERDKYPTTCTVTAEYESIFDDKQEKTKKAELLKRLEANDRFVEVIRSRIVEYMDWYKKTRAFCANEKAAKPQVAALADEFDGLLAKIQKMYEDKKLQERTPDAAKALNQKVRELIDSSEDQKDEKAKMLGRQMRTIGGSQDNSIGQFRLITKALRQRAGYRMMEAKDEVAFGFAEKMREKTAEILCTAFQQDEHPIKN